MLKAVLNVEFRRLVVKYQAMLKNGDSLLYRMEGRKGYAKTENKRRFDDSC